MITCTICVSASLICVALTLWGNIKHGGVVSLETFIGVMAAFIGICATIIVGFQIINILELYKAKEEIRKFEDERKAYEDMLNVLKSDVRLARNGVSNALRVICHFNKQHTLNTLAYLISIITYVPKEGDDYASNTLYRAYYKLNYLISNHVSNCPKRLKDVVKRNLPYMKEAKIPEWIDNYDEIVQIRKRVIRKIELL